MRSHSLPPAEMKSLYGSIITSAVSCLSYVTFAMLLSDDRIEALKLQPARKQSASSGASFKYAGRPTVSSRHNQCHFDALPQGPVDACCRARVACARAMASGFARAGSCVFEGVRHGRTP